MANRQSQSYENAENAAVFLMKHVENAVAGMRFGSVQIVVHAGKVMQIERSDKFGCFPMIPVDDDVR